MTLRSHKLLCYVLVLVKHMLGACAQVRLGCNSELILDEFGEKLLEELDYQQEARNIQARAKRRRKCSVAAVQVRVNTT